MSRKLCLCLSIVLLWLGACAPTKSLDVWKDEGYAGGTEKILVCAVTQKDHIRNQMENNLAHQLSRGGLQAVPSNKVFPELTPDMDREAAEAKVKELGIDSILLIRSISRKEITNHQYGGLFFAPTSVRYDGWYSYYTGSFMFRQRAYDTEYFNLVTTLYDLESKKAVWSYLSQVRVAGSRQAAINQFIPTLVAELDDSELL